MGVRARLWPGLRTRSIWLDLVIALLGAALVGIGSVTPRPAHWTWILLIPGAVVLGIVLALFRRTRPLVPFAVATVVTAVDSAVAVGLAFGSYAVGRYVSRWPLRIAAAVIGTIAVIQPWAGGPMNEQVNRVITIAPAILLPGAIGVYLRTRTMLLLALRERAERAEAERELLARDAVLTERTRIAREMHDAVGHRVSLMVLQAGAIELAAGDRPKVEQLASQVQTAGRQALEELRQMVGVLRAGDEAAPLAPQPGLADLPRLVAEAREAGMDVELRCAAEAPVDPGIGRAAYRIVQEALTNAGKHAPGAHVRVSVERDDDALTVRVVNGAAARPAGDPHSGGFGLVGLAERVRTLGGTLTAQPRLDGGFGVEAVLPT